MNPLQLFHKQVAFELSVGRVEAKVSLRAAESVCAFPRVSVFVRACVRG